MAWSSNFAHFSLSKTQSQASANKEVWKGDIFTWHMEALNKTRATWRRRSCEDNSLERAIATLAVPLPHSGGQREGAVWPQLCEWGEEEGQNGKYEATTSIYHGWHKD